MIDRRQRRDNNRRGGRVTEKKDKQERRQKADNKTVELPIGDEIQKDKQANGIIPGNTGVEKKMTRRNKLIKRTLRRGKKG